jgi:hypothetical protein
VFIGIRLDQEGITAQLDSCLLTGEEQELGENAWKAWPTPWQEGQQVEIEG